LAAQRTLDRTDLVRYPLITSTQTPEPEARWFFTRVFGRTAPRIERLSFPLTEVMMDAARAGMGVAVLSEWIAIPYLTGGDLVVKRLRSGAPSAAMADRVSTRVGGRRKPPRRRARRCGAQALRYRFFAERAERGVTLDCRRRAQCLLGHLAPPFAFS
jgi:DNA-binding transcriptional LysR family regulator